MHWLPVILILPYFLLIMKIYRRLLKAGTFKSDSTPSVTVSVIVACRNEQENLPHLLDCLSLQDYPENLFEVVIVDDNSTDRTFKTASSFNGIKRMKLVSNMGRGKKEAIRTGVMSSTGELLITTDADCTMDRSWIRTVAAFYEEKRPGLIIGPVRMRGKGGFLTRFQELEFLGLQAVTSGTALEGNAIMCNGANLVFPGLIYHEHSRNLVPAVESGDDIFMLHSIKKDPASAVTWLESPEAIVTTCSSPGLASLMHQRRRWLSKWKYYEDRQTIITAWITFLTVLLMLSMIAALFFNPEFAGPLVAVVILKSVPDYLVLQNRAKMYGQKNLLRIFPAAQVIYPLYVTGVVVFSIARSFSKGS
jgi:biofilm PGA synthesis N-glycosyltransferase PgaC